METQTQVLPGLRVACLLNDLAALENDRNAIVKMVMDVPEALAIADAYARLQERVSEATAKHTAEISSVRKQIEETTLALGETVKGATYMAVWSKPRITWDGRILECYVIAHPELSAARRVGQPSIAIRPVKGGDSPMV
jgi:hypothetical protein